MGRNYSIHEAAELLGISADAIRLYEKNGLVEPIRNESNGYRYYEGAQIQRIMGISLYRKLDVSIAEIKRLLQVSDFETMISSFEGFIKKREEDIKALQNQVGKLQVMKAHMEEIQNNVGVYSVKELPGRYIKQLNDTGILEYHKMASILSSRLFSFGNLCYRMRQESSMPERAEALEFVIREQMAELCMEEIKNEGMEYRSKCDCIYTVCIMESCEEILWDFYTLFAYAQEQGCQCSGQVYAFYVYSLIEQEKIVNYYEIYAPFL